MTAPRLLTAQQVADRTTLTADCLRKWARQGVGPAAFRLGRRWVWPEADLDAWLLEARRNALRAS